MSKRSKHLAQVTFLLVGLIAFDMLIGRSLYHPLVHFYRLVSWGVCQRGVAACDHKQTPKAVGQSAVATSHYEATRVGIEVIKAGGNAVDAAIAVGYALAVVHPCCGNLGGGGFMTLRLSDDTNRFINFRETAPLAATPTLYQDSEGEVIKGLSTDSYLAVAVPGTVAGLEYARKAYGSGQLTRQQLIAPAQKLANDGFVLTGPEQKLLTRELKNNQNSEVVDIFIQEGKAIEVGDRLVQPELGETLSLLAKNGASTFYEGEIAQKIVEASQQHNGILTLEDFKTYQVQDIDPLTCNYRGFTILTSPPPGGGPVLCQMLNIVEGFPISQVEYYSAQHLHQMLSAMLFAYRDRNLYFGDPTFVEVPTARILSKAYAKELRSKIPKDRALELAEELSLEQKGKNTTHFSVVDKEGNAVSVTYTINTLFGAGVIAPGTGFFLNNEMDDFTAKVGTANTYGLVQGSVNSIEPGKQPLSSMAPTIVLDASNEIALVTGSPGGSTIPTTIFQIITNLVDFNLSPDRAVNQPRIHYQGSPNTVLTEPFALPGDTFVDLWNYGYRVSPSIHWGAAMSIARKDKKLQAIKDFRRQQAEARAVDD